MIYLLTPTQPFAHTAADAARRLGVSRQTFYALSRPIPGTKRDRVIVRPPWRNKAEKNNVR